jgi:MFS family permease
MTVGEVPTGYVGDRIGRRNSLLVGSAVSAAMVLAFGLLSSFPAFVAVYLVWGVGMTFRSGAESAWLYDTLEEAADEDEFTRVRGRGTAVRLAATGASALVGGYLAGVDLYLPFVATGAFTVVGGAVALTIPKNRAYRAECRGADRPADCPDPDAFGPRDAVPVVRDALAEPPLRTFVLAVAAFSALAWAAATFTQPIVEDLALAAGVAEGGVTPLLGWLYAGFSGVAAVVSYHADRIESLVGARRWALLAPAVLGVAFLAAALVPVLAIPAFFLMRALVHATDVLKDRHLNEHADAVGRTTVLSAAAMVVGVARVPARLLSGAVGDLTSPLGAVAAMGALLVATAAGIGLLTGSGWRSGDDPSAGGACAGAVPGD